VAGDGEPNRNEKATISPLRRGRHGTQGRPAEGNVRGTHGRRRLVLGISLGLLALLAVAAGVALSAVSVRRELIEANDDLRRSNGDTAVYEGVPPQRLELEVAFQPPLLVRLWRALTM
jgi:hypothetical protein